MHVDMFEVRIKEERTVGRSCANIVFTDLIVEFKMRVIVVTSIWPSFKLKTVCTHISQIYFSFHTTHFLTCMR